MIAGSNTKEVEGCTIDKVIQKLKTRQVSEKNTDDQT